jgi:hypothetical protein
MSRVAATLSVWERRPVNVKWIAVHGSLFGSEHAATLRIECVSDGIGHGPQKEVTDPPGRDKCQMRAGAGFSGGRGRRGKAKNFL